MPDTPGTEETPETPGTGTEVDPAPKANENPSTDEQPEGADQLGDPGKKALDTMKAERNKARQEAKDAKAAIQKMQADLEILKNGGETPEQKATREQRESAETAATAKANERILKAELKAAAAGKLNDPQDAIRFLDLSEFEVNSDGDIDSNALSTAIADLIKEKPYLAAATARFQGGADGGPKGNPTGPKQLSRSDLAGMEPEQVETARKAGQLNDLLGIKS